MESRKHLPLGVNANSPISQFENRTIYLTLYLDGDVMGYSSACQALLLPVMAEISMWVESVGFRV